MFLIASLTYLVVLATGIVAGPTVIRDDSHISLPISRHLNHDGNLGIIQRDRSRLNNRKRSSILDEPHSLPLNNTGIVYSARVGIGDPPTYCECYQFSPGVSSYSYMPISDSLILDTGSANTWVGANKEYQVTSSSVKTGDFVVRIVSRTDS